VRTCFNIFHLTTYDAAWNSAHVLCALTIGIALLIGCILYEYFFTPKEPYIPLSLFRNLEYDAVAITMAVVAMAFYGFRSVIPFLVKYSC
jgi:hypothetical protein